MQKKAMIKGILKLVMLILAILLLTYLIRNNWNLGSAVNDFLSLFGKP